MTDDEKRTLALLEANHVFPGPYPLSVIALNTAEVSEAIRRSVEEGLGAPLADTDWEVRVSAGGKYASHRVAVPCGEPADVLRLYERLRRVDGVVTVL